MTGRVRLSRLAPWLVLAAALLPFLGVLSNGFVDWDDQVFLTGNPHFRGFAWVNLRWMFANTLQCVYQPLAWLTLALDHALWGMEPGGYHLQSLLWHASSSVLFYLVARRLLSLGRAETEEEVAPGALAAALLFAVHPLRTEAIAWASERRELVGDFFFMAAVLSYLRPKRPLVPVTVFLLLALLAKGTMLSLPLVLLALDFFPLKRIASPRDLLVRALEKWPLFALSGLFGLLGALAARAGGEDALSFAAWSPVQRLAQVAYGLAFYARKTLWPSGLCFLYRMPPDLRPGEARFVLSGLAVAAALAVAWALRRRFPALLAASAAYAAALFPVAGVMKYGPHLAADRYSNLSGLPVVLLLAGAFVPAERRWRAEMRGLLAAVVLALGVLAARQTATWRDSLSLWTRAAAVVPDDPVVRSNIGVAAAERGDRAAAEAELSRAYAAGPRVPLVADDWGSFLAGEGRWKEAAAVFEESLRTAPGSAFVRARHARALRGSGRPADAEREYRAALAADPRSVEAWYGLGLLLMERGRDAEARRAFASALSVDPSHAESRVDLGLLLSRAGRRDEAAVHYRAAVASGDAPTRALAHHDWANDLCDEGRLAAALPHHAEAVRLSPGFVAARFNLGNTLARLGRYREAADAFRGVLLLDPKNEAAARSLRAAASLSGRR